MLFKTLFTTAVVSLFGSAAALLPELEIVGNKFYYSNNGSRFLMKGVAYQANPQNTSTSGFVDPLGDPKTCKRDIPLLQQLETNVIRVYALNTSLDHTECMQMLDDAGIYVIADLSEPDVSINRDDPKWDVSLLERYTSVVDTFHNYTNILGFFAGNEVTNEASNTNASAYVKAAVRDTKAYIKQKDYRNIPVGYSANDDLSIRVDLADYFACGSEDERADFFGINMYEWCGSSTFAESGYKNTTEHYKNLGIPIFFSEYGCNRVTPRKFQEVGTIYSLEMTDVWSGAIVYMYFEEENHYGLVSIDSLGSASTLGDFNNLKSQLQSVSFSAESINPSATSTGTSNVTSCPAVDGGWLANTALPPTPDNNICKCMQNSLSCVIKDSVDSEDYGDLFGYICGPDGGVDCGGISGNATSGKYGAYSGCNAKAQLDFVANLYYKKNGGDASACDFNGSGTTQSASTGSACASVISKAGSSGLGSVTGEISNASATGSDKSGSGGKSSKSGSKSGSSDSSSSSKGAAASLGASGSLWMTVCSFVFLGFGLIVA